MKKKIKTFFEEKQLDSRIYEYEIEGMLHIVESEIVIDFLINSLDAATQKKIFEKIVYIDFKNGDFHHFLEYCGKGMIMASA